jgi:hypothetical protein
MKHLMLAAVLICAPLAAGAATISGAFYDVGGRTNFNNVNSNNGVGAGIGAAESANAALSYIGSNAANATFQSTGINYNMTSPYGMPASIGAFLGGDSATLSGGASTPFLGSILVFTGTIKLLAGNNSFNIFSDDGFVLEVDGSEVGRFEGLRAPQAGDNIIVASTGGIKSFRLVYFEGSQTQAALRAKLNGEIMVAAVPLPAGGLLLIGAIGGLAVLRRRKLAA